MFHNKLIAIVALVGIVWAKLAFAQSYGGGQPQFLTQASTAVTPNQNTSVSAYTTTGSCTNAVSPQTTVSTTGDALIVIVSTAANGTVVTPVAPVAPTVNTMTGYTKAIAVKSSDNLTDTEIWYKLNNTASTTLTGPTITLNAGTAPTSGGGCYVGAWIGDFSNVATSSALDQTASNSIVATTASPESITSATFSAGAVGACASNCVTITFAANPFVAGDVITVANVGGGMHAGTFTVITATGTTDLYTDASGAACASGCGNVTPKTLQTGTTSATAQANELVINAAAYQPTGAGNNASTTASSWVPAAALQLTDPQPGINANNWLYMLENYQPVTAIGTQNMQWLLSAAIPEYAAATATFKQNATTQGALSTLVNFPQNLAGLALTSGSVDYHCAPNHTNAAFCAGTCAYQTNPVHLPSAGGTGSGGLDAGIHVDLEPPSGYLGYQWLLTAQIDNTQQNTPLYVQNGHFALQHVACSGCTWQEAVSPTNQAVMIGAGDTAQMTIGGTGAAVGNPHIPTDLGIGVLNFNTAANALACVQMTLEAWTLPVRYGFNPAGGMFNGSNSIGIQGILE